jgi:hypothetical protein
MPLDRTAMQSSRSPQRHPRAGLPSDVFRGRRPKQAATSADLQRHQLFTPACDRQQQSELDCAEKSSMTIETTNMPKKLAKKAAAKRGAAKAAKPRTTAPKPRSGTAAKPVLLAGGNPQIAKAYGDAPVEAYIAAMPGWKRGVGRRLDALIAATVPGVRKAVKWNSPFYGIEGPGEKSGWFLSFHCFTKYVKVAFFRGTSLRPLPPGESKHKDVRYLDIREGDEIDEAQLADWVKQASLLPGDRM